MGIVVLAGSRSVSRYRTKVVHYGWAGLAGWAGLNRLYIHIYPLRIYISDAVRLPFPFRSVPFELERNGTEAF